MYNLVGKKVITYACKFYQVNIIIISFKRYSVISSMTCKINNIIFVKFTFVFSEVIHIIL